jgi:hypothetical protein
MPHVPYAFQLFAIIVCKYIVHNGHPRLYILLHDWDELAFDIFENGIQDIDKWKFSISRDVRGDEGLTNTIV